MMSVAKLLKWLLITKAKQDYYERGALQNSFS